MDVSLDRGNNFTRADLLEKPVQQRRRSEWSWQFFEKYIPITEEVKEQLKEGKKVEITLTSNAYTRSGTFSRRTSTTTRTACASTTGTSCPSRWTPP